jgi:uncharacterized protein (TIGR02145 family)
LKIINLVLFSFLFLPFYSCKKEEKKQSNSVSNTYLEPIKFNSSLNYGSVKDIEGNVYKTIKIGGYTWMAENLKVSKYNDGAPIPNITDKKTWANDTIGAWCYYENDSKYNTSYGKLYNSYVISTKKVCPTGWHVPSSIEWDNMFNSQQQNLPLPEYIQEEDTLHWKYRLFPYDNLYNRYNKSGFTALPAGKISYGTFSGLKSEYNNFGYSSQTANWWTSDTTIFDYHQPLKKGFHLYVATWDYNFLTGQQMGFPDLGISIRCVQD